MKQAMKKARETAKKAGDAAEGAETAAPAAAKKGGKKVCNLSEDGQKCQALECCSLCIGSGIQKLIMSGSQ